MRQRETEHEQGRGREGETESEVGSRLWVVSTEPNMGLELTEHEIMIWAEAGRSTDWATQAPLDVPQFIHSPTERYLGCFQVLAIMNKAAIEIRV